MCFSIVSRVITHLFTSLRDGRSNITFAVTAPTAAPATAASPADIVHALEAEGKKVDRHKIRLKEGYFPTPPMDTMQNIRSEMVAELIGEHLEENKLNVGDVKRFWLHQANLSMNHLIVRKLLGREATEEEAPVILDTYANTSSAGSVIAFHKYQDDLAAGSLAVLSSFGAGYSIGSVILRKR